ncbi:MAG TPA: flagellar hook-basal body complex protein FliE [Caulobacterales bacterium]|nr:flagellar hook-basal body complex protein FliE [Caulobacterales bacterium]
MAIDPVSVSKAYQAVANAAQDKLKSGDDNVDFGALVQNALKEAHATTKGAEMQGMAAATGKSDIVDVVTAISAAESTLETVVAVRDQVIQAYQEILRMPI